MCSTAPPLVRPINSLPTVPDELEVEVQVEDATLEEALEPALVAALPLAVEDLERHVLVGRTCGEADDAEVRAVRRLDAEGGRLGLVDEVGVEDVELVALDRLGRGVVVVVVRLRGARDKGTNTSGTIPSHFLTRSQHLVKKSYGQSYLVGDVGARHTIIRNEVHTWLYLFQSQPVLTRLK